MIDIQRLGQKLLDFIYPPVCGICLKPNRNWLCEKCENQLHQEKNIKILKKGDSFYEEHMAIFPYQGAIRKKILEYKFADQSYLYHTFSQIIINDEKICRFLKKYDIIIPVPIHPKRKGERGYNQSELIAKELSKKQNIPVRLQVLYKTQNNSPQSTLSAVERIKNTENVYAIAKENYEIAGKKVLLLDDVYTTGNTVNQCSKVLKEAEVKLIGVLTIAKD